MAPPAILAQATKVGGYQKILPPATLRPGTAGAASAAWASHALAASLSRPLETGTQGAGFWPYQAKSRGFAGGLGLRGPTVAQEILLLASADSGPQGA